MKVKLAINARAQARRYTLYTRLASGLVPALDQVPRLAASPDLGSRGESPLHWFALHGRNDLVLAWIKAGGPVAPDQDGRGPWHWALGATALPQGAMIALLASREVVDALRLSASWIDNQGRDALGTMCLMERSRHFADFARAYPEVAASGISMGVKGRISCIDAWIGSVGTSSHLDFLATVMDDLMGAPSEELPVPMRGGLWTQELWGLALRAKLPDSLWARREAQRIGSVIGCGTASVKRSARI